MKPFPDLLRHRKAHLPRALAAILLAASPIEAQQEAPLRADALVSERVLAPGPRDARLWPPAAADEEDRTWSEVARPLLSGRGAVIGATAGCVGGALLFFRNDGISASSALTGCLYFVLPGTLLGAIWLH